MGVVIEVCVVFFVLLVLEEEFDVFVIIDVLGIFNFIICDVVWDCMF